MDVTQSNGGDIRNGTGGRLVSGNTFDVEDSWFGSGIAEERAAAGGGQGADDDDLGNSSLLLSQLC